MDVAVVEAASSVDVDEERGGGYCKIKRKRSKDEEDEEEEKELNKLRSSKRSKRRSFNWHVLSYVLERVTALAVDHCCSAQRDRLKILIRKRPDCPPESKGSVYEMLVHLSWHADDMEQDRFRKNLLGPRRNHEWLLRNYFSRFNMDVKKFWAYWKIDLWLNEDDADEDDGLTRRTRPSVKIKDLRSFPSPQTSPSSSSSSEAEECLEICLDD
jgi:hypothetical protein